MLISQIVIQCYIVTIKIFFKSPKKIYNHSNICQMFHSLFPKMQIKNETAVPIHNCQVKAIFVHDTGKPKSSTIYACWRRVVVKPAIKAKITDGVEPLLVKITVK